LSIRLITRSYQRNQPIYWPIFKRSLAERWPSLRQRIKEVRQGTDGLLYLRTDEDEGALLRIEPAS